MSLKLYYHPLASFCHKALIAFYEADIAFEPILVDLGDEKSAAAFRAVWPMAKMPVLRHDARDCTVADCAAAPALFYANTVVPFEAGFANLPAYLDRLMARASFARVLQEARPYFKLFPLETKPTIARSEAPQRVVAR
jgi:glutathione S-transferase